MKKFLIATSALAMTAGAAAADVNISGYGRTGVIYYENSDVLDDAGLNEFQVVSRLRMNLDATTSSESGVDFGARFRLQWDQNTLARGNSGELNAGKLWIKSEGLTVEVGNVDTAFDSSGLIYATELGSYDRSVGFSNVTGGFYAYNTGRYAGNRTQHYNGVAAKYTIAGATVRASYIDPDQSGLILPDDARELGFSVDYTWNDRLELSAAYVNNGLAVEDNDIFFVGARYAVMDNARIGLNYVDVSNGTALDQGDTFALYGDYTLADGRTNIEAYIANNNADDFPFDGVLGPKTTDVAYGIGVNYDLGGARLGASLQRDYRELVTADMGVRFEF